MIDNTIRTQLVGVLKIEDNVAKSLGENENLRVYGLNSFRAVELVIGLETELGIEIKEDDLLIENLDTIAKIKKLMASYA